MSGEHVTITEEFFRQLDGSYTRVQRIGDHILSVYERFPIVVVNPWPWIQQERWVTPQHAALMVREAYPFSPLPAGGTP